MLLEKGIATERDLFPSDLAQATAVFITSSTTGVVPVHRVDKLQFAEDSQQTATADDVIENLSAS